MLFSTNTALLAALVPLLALAAPAQREDILAVWQHDKSTGAKSVQVWDLDETKLYGESSGSECSSGAFAQAPLAFDVGSDGSGSLVYGPKTYKIHHDRDYSGGVSCTRRYNSNSARVDCKVPAQQSYAVVVTSGIASTSTFGSMPAPGYQNNTKRAVGPPVCNTIHDTVLEGDGDPHQNYYNKQLSEKINCGAAVQCSASQSNSQSYSIGFSAEVSPTEWISGGFSVEETLETGNEYVCTGQTNDVVCIWYEMAHTAYTVVNRDQGHCGGDTTRSDPFVIKSPNSNNDGGRAYYCVIGDGCGAQGDGYWNDVGPAGGPP